MQQPGPDQRRRGVPCGLVVMRQEVLEQRRGLPEHRIAAAQPGAVRGGQPRGEQRVLGVAFLVPAPARVAEQVDHRRPDVQADRRIPPVQRPHLRADGRANRAGQLRIPGRAQPHGLREDRGRAEPGGAVQGFGAGPERRYAEPGHAGRPLVQQPDLLLGGQLGEDLVRAPAELCLVHPPSTASPARLPRATPDPKVEALRRCHLSATLSRLGGLGWPITDSPHLLTNCRLPLARGKWPDVTSAQHRSASTILRPLCRHHDGRKVVPVMRAES